LRIGRIRALFSSLAAVQQAWSGVTARAMAQMKPTISRAIAVVTTTFAFPAATKWR
jgi:hypothetical protein